MGRLRSRPPTTDSSGGPVKKAATVGDVAAALAALGARPRDRVSITLSEPDHPRRVELRRRQDASQDALAAALRQVGEQRCGASQLRAYAGGH